MARMTAAERREEEYRIEERIRNRIACVNTWEDARAILQDQPRSGFPGAATIGEFRYFFSHLQRAVEGLPPYKVGQPEYYECVPASASADELRMFQTIVPRLVSNENKCSLVVAALQRAIDERQRR